MDWTSLRGLEKGERGGFISKGAPTSERNLLATRVCAITCQETAKVQRMADLAV